MKKKFRIKKTHHPALDFLKYIGPGLLVTVGFIDPGNWATNLAAGSDYGYKLLWVITFSTIILIFLQHNAAHLGIVTGKCLSEGATEYLPEKASKSILFTAIGAAVSTAMAEILGGAIALNMLFHLPIKVGGFLVTGLIVFLLFTNSYPKLEKFIMAFVSLIGIAFLVELFIVQVDWGQAAVGWIAPSIPKGSLIIVMSVLGAVVMPHNLFLHSEIIQSRHWNVKEEKVIRRQLKYEFLDTASSMAVGWAINSAIIIVAATAFYKNGISVNDLAQAQNLLKPLLGNAAALIFAIALLFAGVASTLTAGMAGGSIFAGIFKEPYDIKDSHSKIGVGITLGLAFVIILFVNNPFKALIYSQMMLSIQLPITIFLQIYLTSSKRVMGKFVNSLFDKIVLLTIGTIISGLNIWLLAGFLTSL